jgi:deazaflavin-dependent oxidoreductase (nitroreductase family)
LEIYGFIVGLATDLDYSFRHQNRIRRRMVYVASKPFFSKVNSKVLPALDRTTLRLSRGRATLTSMMVGVPVLWLTTTGARSERTRTVPLLAFPIGEGLGLIGTRFGQESTPGWVHNLEADPVVLVSYRGTEVPARARAASPIEADEIWAIAAATYPGYSDYAERASHRRIRVFVLDAGQ